MYQLNEPLPTVHGEVLIHHRLSLKVKQDRDTVPQPGTVAIQTARRTEGNPTYTHINTTPTGLHCITVKHIGSCNEMS